jgi:protocatechuate 3,4-dioxygenase beta subunit
MSKPAEYFQRDRSRHPVAYTPGYKTSVARSPRLAPISLEQSSGEITGPPLATMISANSTMT